MPTECPGGSQRPCGGNGRCGGDGSRQGDGLCQCHAGYQGELCLDCSDGYFSSLRNQTHSVCTGGCQPWGAEVMCATSGGHQLAGHSPCLSGHCCHLPTEAPESVPCSIGGGSYSTAERTFTVHAADSGSIPTRKDPGVQSWE